MIDSEKYFVLNQGMETPDLALAKAALNYIASVNWPVNLFGESPQKIAKAALEMMNAPCYNGAHGKIEMERQEPAQWLDVSGSCNWMDHGGNAIPRV